MVLFRIESEDTVEDVIERFREVLLDVGYDLDLVDEDVDGFWSEYGLRRSRDDV